MINDYKCILTLAETLYKKQLPLALNIKQENHNSENISHFYFGCIVWQTYFSGLYATVSRFYVLPLLIFLFIYISFFPKELMNFIYKPTLFLITLNIIFKQTFLPFKQCKSLYQSVHLSHNGENEPSDVLPLREIIIKPNVLLNLSTMAKLLFFFSHF